MYNLESYQNFKNILKSKKESFTCLESNYTKTVIVVGKGKFMFGKKKVCNNELKLIRLVREDAKKFLSNTDNSRKKYVENISKSDIEFYKYYKTQSEKVFSGYKIDVKSAYWQYAINIGVISSETVKYFETAKFENKKEARLRALGSLATIKVKSVYIDGKRDNDMDEVIFYDKGCRNLYLYICEGVTDLMREVSMTCGNTVFYYYWDCLFVNESANLTNIIKEFDKHNFRVTIEKSLFSVDEQSLYVDSITDCKSKSYAINRYDV